MRSARNLQASTGTGPFAATLPTMEHGVLELIETTVPRLVPQTNATTPVELTGCMAPRGLSAVVKSDSAPRSDLLAVQYTAN